MDSWAHWSKSCNPPYASAASLAAKACRLHGVGGEAPGAPGRAARAEAALVSNRATSQASWDGDGVVAGPIRTSLNLYCGCLPAAMLSSARCMFCDLWGPLQRPMSSRGRAVA